MGKLKQEMVRKRILECLKQLGQKDCPWCGETINPTYPFYRNDGSRFVVCDNCGYILELDYK